MQDFHFNPRAPYGARLPKTPLQTAGATFQSTRPVWGATITAVTIPSIICDFNPRAPYGARRLTSLLSCDPAKFQSTRPVWGATPVAPALQRDADAISIHAPRMGRDAAVRLLPLPSRKFQSTRPVWGATSGGAILHDLRFISIHAPRMGRDSKTAQFSCTVLRKSNSKYNAADNSWAKYACGIVQATRTYPNFRCEAPGKSLSACASHSDHQHALRLIAGL